MSISKMEGWVWERDNPFISQEHGRRWILECWREIALRGSQRYMDWFITIVNYSIRTGWVHYELRRYDRWQEQA